MVDYWSAATRYVDVALGRTDKGYLKANADQGYPRGRMFAEGDSLFSYGNHFTICTLVRDAKGAPLLWLINGDRASNTTSKQQGAARSALSRSGLDKVIIPFSVLDEAGIDYASVRKIDVSDDWTEKIVETRTDQPESTVWRRDKIIDVREEKAWFDGNGNPWKRPFKSPYDLPHALWRNGKEHGIQFGLLNTLSYSSKADSLRGKHEEVTVPEVSHLSEPRLYSTRGNYPRPSEWDVEYDENGKPSRYTRTRYRHWLGASVITGSVTYQKPYKCPTCKGSGKAEAPWQESWSVRRWKALLSDWEQFHEEWDASNAKRAAEWDKPWPVPEHYTVPSPRPVEPPFHTHCDTCGGRGRLTKRATRRAYFLSGFDSNETRPSYFFCELPPGAKPTTVDEAFEALKPEPVLLAERLGREVKRQGDIFAIPTEFTRATLKSMGATFQKGGSLLGTNHKATEVATLPDGTILAHGTLTHAPEFRRPDHKRVTIGRGYSLIVKNTVPVGR